jgi:hypothetical protein
MKTLPWLLTGVVVLVSAARAEVAPLAVRVPEAQAWIG